MAHKPSRLIEVAPLVQSSTMPSDTMPDAIEADRASLSPSVEQRDTQGDQHATPLVIEPVPQLVLDALPHLMNGEAIDTIASDILRCDPDALRTALATPQALVLVESRLSEWKQALMFRSMHAMAELIAQADNKAERGSAARYMLSVAGIVPRGAGRGRQMRELPRQMSVTLVRKGDADGVHIRLDGQSTDD